MAQYPSAAHRAAGPPRQHGSYRHFRSRLEANGGLDLPACRFYGTCGTSWRRRRRRWRRSVGHRARRRGGRRRRRRRRPRWRRPRWRQPWRRGRPWPHERPEHGRRLCSRQPSLGTAAAAAVARRSPRALHLEKIDGRRRRRRAAQAAGRRRRRAPSRRRSRRRRWCGAATTTDWRRPPPPPTARRRARRRRRRRRLARRGRQGRRGAARASGLGRRKWSRARRCDCSTGRGSCSMAKTSATDAHCGGIWRKLPSTSASLRRGSVGGGARGKEEDVEAKPAKPKVELTKALDAKRSNAVGILISTLPPSLRFGRRCDPRRGEAR